MSRIPAGLRELLAVVFWGYVVMAALAVYCEIQLRTKHVVDILIVLGMGLVLVLILEGLFALGVLALLGFRKKP